MAKKSYNRVIKVAKHGGVSYAKKEASKAASYFAKNAKHITKPLTTAMGKAAVVSSTTQIAKFMLKNNGIIRGWEVRL